jgi:hypothetical protein
MMAQDNPNDTTQVGEPQATVTVPDDATPTEQSAEPSANALGAEPITAATLVIADGTESTDAPGRDDAADEIPDAEAEESEDVGDPTDAPASSSDASSASTSQPPDAPSAKSEEETDDRSEIEKQPYDFDHCTVQVAIQLLPDDGDANGRMVVVGVRSHLDAPILRVTRLNELGALPPLVTVLLAELKADLPNREQAARQAIAKKKEESARRKSVVTASRTPRGKKNAKATTLSTASIANAPTDNRPRPEVMVPTNPQQQMGLF